MVPQQRIELRIDAYKATVIPFNYKGETGGDEWIRATNLLRMKELHYRCATSPKTLVPQARLELAKFGF